MTSCPRCAGLAKALRAAERRNLAHAKRATALETLVKEMLDHGDFSPHMLKRLQASKLRLDAGQTA
ncbi:hypothetical protein [Solidesulfovibrio sp.]